MILNLGKSEKVMVSVKTKECLYQIRDDTVYVEYILDCRRNYS